MKLQGHDDADEPGHWTGSTRLLDLGDPRLRVRSIALTQFCQSDRERALAIYGFVKRRPFGRAFKMGPRSAREVLDAGTADGPDKATLMVALLRLAGLPARMRIMRMRGAILRGLVSGFESVCWPVVEVWIDSRWIGTDNYIFDDAYAASARCLLRAKGRQWGYGIRVDCPARWTALEHAQAPPPFAQDSMLLEDMGTFHDPEHCMASGGFQARYWRLGRYLRWNLLVPGIWGTTWWIRHGHAVLAGQHRTDRR